MAHTPTSAAYRAVVRQFRLAAATVAVLLVGGAVFYHLVEKLPWVDSFYFCVITLATVGYGDIVPKTDAEKIFTVFYVLAGIGVITTFANIIVQRAVARREERGKTSDD